MKLDELNDGADENEFAEPAIDTGEELDPTFVTGAKPKMGKGTMGALGLLLACGGAMYFLYTRQGPQSAHAADTTGATTTINDFLAGDAGNVKMMNQTLRETEKVVQEFRSYPGKTQVPVDALKTNPFRLGTDASKPAVEDPDDSVMRRRREEERLAIVRAVEGLQLQSILHGARKACMINNTLYQEGQEVEGFLIEQIAPRSVVLRKGDYRFDKKMSK